jgi:hypothetical protein
MHGKGYRTTNRYDEYYLNVRISSECNAPGAREACQAFLFKQIVKHQSRDVGSKIVTPRHRPDHL